MRLSGLGRGPLCAVLLALVATAPVTAGDEGLQQRIRAHIEFLASDLLEGREAGTPGYDIAAAYVASQFRQIGLEPAGQQGSYYQQVPLRRAWQEAGSAELSLRRDERVQAFRFVEEFYISPNTGASSVDVEAPMVFAGYGIEAPALDYSDLDQVDLAGKIAVILSGQPVHFPSEEGAHFGSSREKAMGLARRGALGSITIFTPRNEKRSPWSRVRSRVGKPSMSWLDEGGRPYPDYGEYTARARLHYRPAAELFAGAPFSLQQLIDMDEAGEGLPVFPLEGTARVSQQVRHENVHSANVVAVLPGSDPTLSSEHLVYVAHLDHIGTLAGEGHEDAIRNGALDNASGISIMIETARMFAGGERPRRSILFLAVTAEEKGLVGSEYFARNPTVPRDAMVGVINIDMPILLYDFADLIAFGAEHSTISDAIGTAAQAFDTRLTPDPFPEQNLFVRSDHYRFVQQGIPAVFLVTGIHSRSENEDADAIFGEFIRKHYHRTSDEASLPIHYGAAARFTRINHRAGALIANGRERPRWHEGDFFGEAFGR
ncbi:MAG: M28 family metallopeptidase [Xanthomonadales bacterium]|nr:M28 family metallopeptidase [Xanthomonadales bacterium]